VQLTSAGGEAFSGGQSVMVASAHGQQNGATILQCAAQPGDGQQQFYIQGGQVIVQGEGVGGGEGLRNITRSKKD